MHRLGGSQVRGQTGSHSSAGVVAKLVVHHPLSVVREATVLGAVVLLLGVVTEHKVGSTWGTDGVPDQFAAVLEDHI